MKKLLIYKNCRVKNCNNQAISVRGQNPFCREHVYTFCDLKTHKNIFNERRCNSTVSIVCCEGKTYCNAHYRTLIQKCNEKTCSKLRNDNILSFDKKWYCKKHKKIQNKKFLSNLFFIFRSKLPPEITENIYKFHLKNNAYIL